MDHLRFIRQASRSGTLHCFLLDCSASMLGGERLSSAKGLILACFDHAAVERSEAALICFGGGRANVRFGPAIPRWWNERWVEPIGGGGGTPLSAGIASAANLLERAKRRNAAQERVLWVLGDGRTRDRPARPLAADRIVIVDFEQGNIGRAALGRWEQLAREWNADYLHPEDIAVREPSP
ncbi:vWA domain-containing protein [Trinickia dinghuensis]|uniref:VWA domain-containing protein n=1 Tax=Trinickia dinghuensis TaxID=2291023 RepID=A0A3D8JWA2_9BURK|nr:VWA domain-containing protein [Trinickia dinghuensis]